MDKTDFEDRVLNAIHDYLEGLTGPQAAGKYGISVTTLRRQMKSRRISLSESERRRRKAEGGRKTQRENPHVSSQPCNPGCTCKRHQPPRNKVYPIIMGRKICGKCRRWRLLLDFDARQRDVEGNAIAWQTHCKTCVRERCRIHAGIKRRGKPYQPRYERPRMTPEQYRARKRERYHELKQDPEWHERRKEYMRIYAEVKRREKGIKARVMMFERRKSDSVVRDPQLPIEPFQRWIKERAAFYAKIEGLPGGIAGLAKACKITDRSLRRYLDGHDNGTQISHISLGTVDHCLTNEGSTFMWELYGDEIVEAA